MSSGPDASIAIPAQALPPQSSAGGKVTDVEPRVTAVNNSPVQPEITVPPHRSHDPLYNQKRSDPFMFGSRYLTEQDDVFEFNAWDHVETDDAYKQYAEEQYAKQREAPVSDYDKTRFNTNPARWWDTFYRNNTANFFQNRKWLQQEFPILADVCKPDAGPVTIVEIGAGAGNTAFPILANNQNPFLKVHACDYSKAAVDVMRGSPSYDPKHIVADVWDVAGQDPLPGVADGSVDVAVMIFVFSALSPRQWTQAVRNVHRLLKPNGLVLFRDYGRGDLAQVRFRKGRYLEENFYIRGDGTRVYFFDQDELKQIWTGQVPPNARCDVENPAATRIYGSEEVEVDMGTSTYPPFAVENLGVDRRLLINRKEKIKMYRCWLQGQFRKLTRIDDSTVNKQCTPPPS